MAIDLWNPFSPGRNLVMEKRAIIPYTILIATAIILFTAFTADMFIGSPGVITGEKLWRVAVPLFGSLAFLLAVIMSPFKVLKRRKSRRKFLAGKTRPV